jgi:hypothetical protein
MNTDKMNLLGTPFLTINICDVEVEVRRVTMGDIVYFNAYAGLKDSSTMNEDFLGCPTWRNGDWVGVDTIHSHNMEQCESERLADALIQIQSIIEKWKEVVKNGKS